MHKVSHRDQEGLGQDRQGHLLCPSWLSPYLSQAFVITPTWDTAPLPDHSARVGDQYLTPCYSAAGFAGLRAALKTTLHFPGGN